MQQQKPKGSLPWAELQAKYGSAPFACLAAVQLYMPKERGTARFWMKLLAMGLKCVCAITCTSITVPHFVSIFALLKSQARCSQQAHAQTNID